MPDNVKKSGNKSPENKAVATKNKAKKRNKVIVIVLAITLLLSVIVGAIYFFGVRQSPDNVVMSAVIKSIEADDIKANGTIITTMDEFDGKLDVTFSSAKANQDGSFDAEITYESANIEDPLSVEGKAILASDGTLYIKMNNVTGVAKTVYSEMDNVYSRVQMEGSTAQPFKVNELIINMTEMLNDRWVKLPATQGNGSESSLNPFACMQGVFAKYNANSAERDALIEAYKNNDFLVIDTKSLDDKGSSDGYRVSIDADKFKTFNSEVEKTTVGKMLADCSDSDSSIINQVEENKKESIDLWINKYTHDITHASIDADNGTKLSVEFKYGDGAKVTVPKDAKTIVDIFSKSNLEAEAKKQ